MHGTVQSIYKCLTMTLGVYGLGLLIAMGVIAEIGMLPEYPATVALSLGWWVMLASLCALFPALRPEALSSPKRKGHAALVLLFQICVALTFGASSVFLVSGFDVSWLMAPVVLAPVLMLSMLTSIVGIMLSRKSDDTFKASATNTSHTAQPAPQTAAKADVLVFRSVRAQRRVTNFAMAAE